MEGAAGSGKPTMLATAIASVNERGGAGGCTDEESRRRRTPGSRRSR
ncbi:hypothetical protein [Propionicicella superfundia]